MQRFFVLTFGAFALFVWGPSAGYGQIETFVELRESAKEWAKIKDALIAAETEWQSERSLLQASLNASLASEEQLEARIESLRTEAESRREAERRARRQADQTERRLKDAIGRIDAFCQRLVQYRSSLPPRLSRSLELPYRTIGDESLAATERLNAATSIVNRSLAFNRTIALAQEQIRLPEGPSDTLFEVIYWGLSHAYAVDRTRQRAYLGSPVSGGWQWKPAPEFSEAIAAAIDIRKGVSDPRFVPLPVSLNDSIEASSNSEETAE